MLRTHTFRCCVFCLVAFAAAGTIAAQSPPADSLSYRRSAIPPAVRPDIAQFGNRVEAALSAEGPAKGSWGILVSDAATGEVLYERNADSYFTPASDAKLFSTALALATLGPDYRIRTTVAASGTLDANGFLDGDLVLIGRGDANLSNRVFPYEKRVARQGPPEKVLAELADAVVARGVKEIKGDVVADDSLFQSERFPSGWAIDDMQWSYGAPVSAIAVNDNTFTIILRPGMQEGDPATYEAGFAADFYTIESSVQTSIRGSEEKLAVTREPGSRLIRMSGTMPVGDHPRVLTLAIEQPAEYVAKLLAHLLSLRGVMIDGAARARHAGDPPVAVAPPQTIMAEHISVPLSEDILLTNKESENLHAELLLLLSAHEKTGATSYEEAQKFAVAFFKTAGIADGDVVIGDGSGLSRRDLVTPRAVVQLLRYAATQPWGELYRSSLPVSGEDGTLTERMKGTPAAGRVFAKTGTIGTEHVNALSGYATTVGGANLVFSIFGNNNNLRVQAVNSTIDAIVEAMVEELGPAPVTRRKK